MGKNDANNEELREPILKLGKMVTNRVPIVLGMEKLTKDDPEYWGLATLLTDEQAEVALKMKRRVPRTLDDMVRLTGMERDHVEKIMEDMSRLGVVEYNWENEKHEKQYVLPMFVPGSAEFTNMNAKLLEEHPEMGRFFERMSFLPLTKIFPWLTNCLAPLLVVAKPALYTKLSKRLSSNLKKFSP